MAKYSSNTYFIMKSDARTTPKVGTLAGRMLGLGHQRSYPKPTRVSALHNSPAPQSQSKCPFAGATTFMNIVSAEGIHAQPLLPNSHSPASTTPLGQAGGAGFATAHLWLSAGVSGQHLPGRLVSGLRKLSELDEFLIELPDEMHHELGLKQR